MPASFAKPATILAVLLCTLFSAGCATNSNSSNGSSVAAGETENVYPTGSRISRSVKKGEAAGIAGDMPGGSSSTKNLEKEGNDMRAQAPITGR